MGCFGSKESKQSSDIDAYLQKEKPKIQSEIKLLLLGAGESGKTTIQKQIKLLYLNGFTNDERSGFRLPIFNNIITCIRALAKAVNDFGLELDAPARTACAVVTRQEFDAVDSLTKELENAIVLLWGNPSVKAAYERQTEFQLYDCAAYVLDNIKRFSSADYLPTSEDILNVRTKTTGFSETIFEFNDNVFKLVDVGGQRNERKKWMYCFQDVTSVLFVVSLSEYDLKLYEDNTTNRMQESLKLFKEISNSKYFVDSSMILFLNKSDLFRQKIAVSPLAEHFPDYKGGDDFESATTFISEKFQAQCTRVVFTHVTCATDTSNIKTVFESVRSTILNSLATTKSV